MRSSVGTLIQRADSRVNGIVTGTLDNPYMPQMVNIPRNADVEDGDAVVTSGFGGVYPKGLMVGHVAAQKSDDSGLLKVAVIETAVDFQRLEDVAIITASREAPPDPIQAMPLSPGAAAAAEISAAQAKSVQTKAESQ